MLAIVLLSITSDGVTVVDTKIPGWGRPLLAKIKEESPTTIDIVAQANTKVNMEDCRRRALKAVCLPTCSRQTGARTSPSAFMSLRTERQSLGDALAVRLSDHACEDDLGLGCRRVPLAMADEMNHKGCERGALVLQCIDVGVSEIPEYLRQKLIEM